MGRIRIIKGIKITGFILIGVIGLGLITTGIVRAALYVIDTTDGSFDEWIDEQGEPIIPVFMTDDPEDVTNPDEDWINAWVASGTNQDSEESLSFLMEVLGPNALSGQERAASAFLDCNNDGLMQKNTDAVVSYDRYNDSSGLLWQDMVVICDGQLQECGLTDRDYGQIIGDNNEFIEWSIPISYLPPNDYSPSGDCRNGPIQIKFLTSDSTYLAPDEIDEAEAGFRGFDVPSNVRLLHLGAMSSSWSNISLLLLGGVMIVVGFGGYLLVISKSKK